MVPTFPCLCLSSYRGLNGNRSREENITRVEMGSGLGVTRAWKAAHFADSARCLVSAPGRLCHGRRRFRTHSWSLRNGAFFVAKFV